jgi:acetylglutamate kinase
VSARTRAPIVLKLGGELLEKPDDLAGIAAGITALAKQVPVVVVHGGGREIDAALAAAGIRKIQIDGLRVTDAPTLDIVVTVLAGTLNTRLVSALRRAGGLPVGLTGADAEVMVAKPAAPFKASSGATIGLGFVGTPTGRGTPRLLTTLLKQGYVPVVACVGATKTGDLLNVNADTLAQHLAVALGARRLVIAGGTSGVFDGTGATIPVLTAAAAARLIRQGTANAGMVAKLQACRAALRGGVADVLIVNGRLVPFGTLAARVSAGTLAGTQVVA